jgi:putative heme iron utilization protein
VCVCVCVCERERERERENYGHLRASNVSAILVVECVYTGKEARSREVDINN